jgi:Fe-S-cluster containining protein
MKTFHQLQVVAKAPFQIGGERFIPPKVFKVSPTFWRRYGCYLHCAACCPLFSLDYLPGEWDNLPDGRLKQESQRQTVQINGQRRTLYSYMPDNPRERFGKLWCDFVDFESGKCEVHTHRPLSCRVELIKFRMVKGRGYMSKQPYGRAWAMKRAVDGVTKPLCDFSPFDREQFDNNDIPVLRQMLRWANYLGIPTHLDTIIHALQVCVDTGQLRGFEIRNDK